MIEMPLFLVLAALPTSGIGHSFEEPVRASAPQENGKQDHEPSIDKLRSDLKQPGPAAKRTREGAVLALLAMPKREAHEVLCESLARTGDDPDRLRIFILTQLQSRWSLPSDAVFGNDTELRTELYRLYTASMVRVFNGGAESAIPEFDDEQRLVWDCLRALSPLDHQRVFESLLRSPDEGIRRSAMWAIAGCRNLGLAPLLADSIEGSGPTAVTARTALAMLAFVEEPFRTRAEFDAWYEAHREVDYVTLVEGAARGSLGQRQARIQQLERQLIGALISAEDVKWSQLLVVLQAATNPESMAAYLGELSSGLERRTTLGGVADDRVALARWLSQGLEGDVTEVELGLRLNVLSRLVVAADAEYKAVVDRLVAGVADPRESVRIASIHGLAEHFSTANRQTVVRAGTDALRHGADGVLAAALACLARRSWVAPAPQQTEAVAAWAGLLEGVVFRAESSVELRSQAIQVLIQQTADDKRLPEAYELLVRIAQQSDVLPVPVRANALSRLRLFRDDSAWIDSYVQTVTGLLADVAPEIREAAARQLGSVPEGARAKREEWTSNIVSKLGLRLLAEPEEAPYRAVFDSLMQLAGAPESPTNVIGRFADAVDKFVKRDPAEQKDFQREMLAAGLSRLGAVQGRPLAQWVRAAEAIALLEDREALRFVLERQRVSALKGQDGSPEIVKAWTYVVVAASFAPLDAQWTAQEATELRLAFSELERLGAPLTQPRQRALRVVALATLEQHDEVLERGSAALTETVHPLDAEGRDAVALAVARARVAKRQFAEASVVLDDVSDESRGSARAVRASIALGHFELKEFDQAAAIMTAVVEATPESDPSYPQRFLLKVEAQFRSDPKAHGAAVLAELQQRAELFQAETTPEAQRTRYSQLFAEIQQSQQG